MAKRQTWEARLVKVIISRRLLALMVVILLQAVLLGGVAGLLWLTKAKEEVAANATASGAPVIVLQEAGDAPVQLLVKEGQAVAPGQTLARVGEQVVSAPSHGVAWGSAFSDRGNAQGEPYLGLLSPGEVSLQVTIRENDRAALPAGADVRIRLDRIDGEGIGYFRGQITEAPNEARLRIALYASGQPADADWQGLGRMLITGSEERVILEARTKRLLTQLLQP